ncbi:MAG: Cytochrome c-type biosis protein CcmH precursor [Pseudomonadota bacterium]
MNVALTFVVLTLLLVVAVLALLVWSLWRRPAAAPVDAHEQANAQVYRDQSADLARELALGHVSEAEHAQALEELKLRLRDDSLSSPDVAAAGASDKPRKTVLALCLLLPVCAVLLYGSLGTPLGLDPAALARSAPDEGPNASVTPEKIAQMVGQLERRLQDEPNNVDAWVMLARLQRSQEKFAASDKSFAKALSLTPDDDLAIERAEVLAQIQGGDFSGEPWAVINRILKANPNQNNALLLAGSASFAEGRFAQAIQYWERVRASLPPQSEDLNALDSALAQARERLAPGRASAQLPDPGRASAQPPSAASAVPARISGRVSLAPELAAQTSPGDTVFIYATPAQGGRMPLAIVRTTVAALPFDFVLDDSQAMGPQTKLSSASEVVLKARISKTGQAMPQPGEFGVSIGPIKNQTNQVSLVIRGPLP